jgi:hypothetical protein
MQQLSGNSFMSSVSTHIIRHVSLDLHYKGKVNGWEVQEEAKQWLNDLFNKLEPELEKISSDKTWLSLDSLNIEIDVHGGSWKEDAINHAARQILDKLQLQRLKISEETKNETHTTQQHFAAIYLHYLQYGHLPWNASHISNTYWEKQVEKLIDGMEANLLLSIIRILNNNGPAILRLVRSVSPGSMLNALQKNINVLETEQKKIIHDARTLIAIAKRHTKNEALTKSFFIYVLYTITKSAKLVVPLSILQEVQLDRSFERIFHKQDFASTAFKSLQEISLQQMPVAKAKEKIERDLYPQNKNELIESKSIADEKQKSKSKKAEKKWQEEKVEISDAIYLSNAGLVIIAAYLARLFENLGWWKDNKWKERNAAVCLLQYIATGQPKMEEFELVLPKILCGLQPEDVIDPTYFFITEQMQQEVTDLLSSVITYWSVLKDTSIDGLRGSFLVRDGKLWKNENKWYLTVEQKGYDMLLQQIPWNISMIQLPWMDEMLTTNWV